MRFDCVIINSVLHWIDRNNLTLTISKIDEIIKENGYLVIGDFQTPIPYKNTYHHKEGVFTYKIAYKEIFKSTGNYLELATICFNHDTKDFKDIDMENYFCVSLLRKSSIYQDLQCLCEIALLFQESIGLFLRIKFYPLLV